MSATQEPQSPFRNDILKDRVVLISGGATGIGFGCAVCFGMHGAKVAIMSRRQGKIDNAVRSLRSKGIDAFGTTVDVRDYKRCVESVKRVAIHFGKIDFLVRTRSTKTHYSHTNKLLLLLHRSTTQLVISWYHQKCSRPMDLRQCWALICKVAFICQKHVFLI